VSLAENKAVKAVSISLTHGYHRGITLLGFYCIAVKILSHKKMGPDLSINITK